MITFREVEVEDAAMILNWRMSTHVTKFMNTDVVYDLDAQQAWLRSSYQKAAYYHWIIEINERPAGLINITDYDPAEGTVSWGFYIGEEDMNGYGAFIPPFLYNFIFNTLEVKTINIEVFYNNTNVIGLHQLHGYRFSPSRDRVIEKKGKEILLIAMTLDVTNWNFKRFAKNIADFPTAHWEARPTFLP